MTGTRYFGRCRACAERRPGCAGSCADYTAARRQYEADARKEREAKRAEQEWLDVRSGVKSRIRDGG
nr:MAG TPA: hypothetical protein [Caudoviricetes sp.]